jgi:hypothetical protein
MQITGDGNRLLGVILTDHVLVEMVHDETRRDGLVEQGLLPVEAIPHHTQSAGRNLL